jgi:hypothetical protein
LGLKKYDSDTPCLRGYVGERDVSGGCIVCYRENLHQERQRRKEEKEAALQDDPKKLSREERVKTREAALTQANIEHRKWVATILATASSSATELA